MSDPQGLAFAALAEDYDLGRAPWPLELLDGIDAECVLDLAAGTGKLTAVLAERFASVVAVEPLPEMRAVLQRNVPEVRAVAGTAELYAVNASCKADTQKSLSNVFDNRHETTYRLCQSKTATTYMNPYRSGMYVMSALHTWSGRLMATSRSKYG